MPVFTTRFAPSPTGYLHLGHAFSALTAFEAAQAAGGRFLLRIEDTDQGRSRPEYEAAILEDLAWLGIQWEQPPRRQSEHMGEYEAVLARLIAMGVCYRCFRTRSELLASIAYAPHGSEGVFFGAPLAKDEEEARLGKGERFAWRLSCALVCEKLGARADALTFQDETGEVKANLDLLGDAIIARKDFPASYHLASVWDDALQGVTHVIRGDDLRESAHLHTVLRALLELPAPLYTHHRLLLNEDGKRLAKRDQAAGLRSMRERGATPADVRTLIGL
jgi:glutamyl-Q tRNA(Asp) synthetase